MNKTIYIPVVGYGGVFTFAKNVTNTLKLGKDDTIIINSNADESFEKELSNLTNTKIKRNKFYIKSNYFERFVMGILLSKYRDNHIIYIDFNPVLDFFAILFSKNFTGFSHLIPNRKLNFIFRTIFSLILSSGNKGIYAVSHFQKKELYRLYYTKDVDVGVIHNTSFLSGNNSEFKISDDKYIKIVTIGHCVMYKGVNEWIECAKQISNKFNNVEFTWYGDGDCLKDAQKQVIDFPNINFPGYLYDVSGVLSKADIYTQFSYKENLSISILDGMNYGLPIVAKRTGAIDELVKHNVNGFVCDNLDELIDSLQILIKNTNKIYEFSKNSKEIFDSQFSKEIWERKLINTINRFEVEY